MEEFREFVANPKLTLMAKEIVAKEKDGGYGGEYGYPEKEEDIAKFNEAADALGVSHKRAEKVYKHVKTQPQWRERNQIVFNVICGIVGAILFAILIWFLKCGWKLIRIKLGG